MFFDEVLEFIAMKMSNQARQSISFVFVALVTIWLFVLSILGIMYLPWPTTDEAHMRQCVSEGGLYKKPDPSKKDWYCVAKVENR